ncbi:MAG: phage holin family protein [Actinomycetota bacterium]
MGREGETFDEPPGLDLGRSTDEIDLNRPELEVPDSHDQSVGTLIKEISEDVSTLVQKEIELAKLEFSEILKTKLRAAALIGIGVVLAAMLIPLLVLSLIEVIAIWLPRWASALIVTGSVAVFALAAFLLAKRFLDSKLMPEKTIQTLKEDVEWAKQLRKH